LVAAAVCATNWSHAQSATAQCEVQQLFAFNADGRENLGESLAFGSAFVVVGASQGEKNVPGTVRFYRPVGGDLYLQVVLESGDCAHALGVTSAADDEVFVVGVSCDQGAPSIGAVDVYRVDEGSLQFDAQLVTSDGAVAHDIDIHDNVIVLGDWVHSPNGVLLAGAAYVFRNRNGVWEEDSVLIAPDPEPDDLFGASVAVGGDVVLVGAHGDNGPSTLTGAAFVFRYDGFAWAHEVTLKPSDIGRIGNNKWFGWSVALDAAGDTAVIGAKEDMAQLGSAYVFEHFEGVWIETQKLQAVPSFGTPAYFGYDVDISDDGNIIIVGAQSDSESGPESGAAHIFTRIGDSWIETYKFIRPSSNCLGASVALHGDYALVGDPCENGFSGAVYLLAGIQGIDCNNNGVPDSCDIAAGTSYDSDGDGIPNECDGTPDFDGDGDIGPDDLAQLLAAWGECLPAPCAGDLNQDGLVGPFDLAQLLAMWGQIIVPAACPKSAETCCQTHDSPGCADGSCCNDVCAIDSFCCETTWDTICVNEAQSLCGCPAPKSCISGGAGDCCAFNGLPGPGCNDPECCEMICDYVDPFCCDVQWDADCAMWALQFCQSCPPIQCSPDAGPCCSPSFEPGCNDPECCSLICEQIDPFCCEAAWDGVCAVEAQLFCKSCGGTPPGE
jgi:hypothetical protein